MVRKVRKTVASAEPVADGLIAMVHPDGGRCDAYRPDKSGVHRVSAADVPDMITHGFVQKEN